MEKLPAPVLIDKIVKSAIVFWALLVIPLMISIFLIQTGHGDILSHDEASWQILYYNLLVSPILIVGSCILSWVMLKKKRYGTALFFAALPLTTIFVELIAADIALWLL